MNRVWDLLHKETTIAVFDIDGTLFSYNYGTFKAHHDLDNEADEMKFRQIDMYAEAKGLPLVRDYIKEHGGDRCWCLSMEPHGHEVQKAEAIFRYYGIPTEHCLFVERSEEKAKRLLLLADELKCPPKELVYIDDNEVVLRQIEKETPFVTAHVTIFFEER